MCKVYDVINSRIMELLQQGTVPWRKTWHSASNQPKNLVVECQDIDNDFSCHDIADTQQTYRNL